MSEVLDQSEIDALLASVATETPPEDAAAAGPAPGGTLRSVPQVEAQLYDFKRPERVSKDQIRALASVHEVFARNFGATLSGLLRTIIDVRVVGVEQLTYSEFIHSMPVPTCFTVLRAPPLEGEMCLEFSPLIVYPIVDRLLGGANSETYIPQRPLTSIEWRLMQRLTEKALDHLSEVWHNLVEAKFELVQTESNPHLVHIVAPSEVVVFITFEIKFGSYAGTMSLCIPFNTIESVLSHLTSQTWFFKPRAADDNNHRRLMRGLQRGAVPLTAYLGRTTLKLSQLRSLQAGDLIVLDKRVEAPLIVQVAGKNKYHAAPGQFRGRRALHLTGFAATDDPL